MITETFYPETGGGETQARLLAENLAGNGLKVLLFTRRTHPSQRQVENFEGFTVFRLPPVGEKQRHKWGLLLTSVPPLIRFRHEYDLIFVSGYRRVGVTAVLASRLLRKPCILKADSLGEMSGAYFIGGLDKLGLNDQAFLFRVLLKTRNRVLKNAHAFVAISSEVAGELARAGIGEGSYVRIPNGVDIKKYYPATDEEKRDTRRKLDIPQNKRVVLYTGRLVSYKGLPLLLQVWRELAREDDRLMLLLVGSGGLDIHNCEGELHTFVEENKMGGSVRFTGSVDNVAEYLRASDLFVFPTEKEAFGISLIEAMACGLPVISTNAGGLKDILRHRQNGLVVRPGDFQELHEALAEVISSPALCESLRRAARRSVEERFSMDSVTQQYIELFTRAAG